MWSPVQAQFDVIGLYADPTGASCLLNDGGGLVNVYVIHTTGGSTASQFQVKPSSGVTFTWIGETLAFAAAIGDTQSGLSIGYGSCFSSDVLVATINYIASGSSSSCSWLTVAPDPNSLNDMIEVINCSESMLEASASRLVINSDGSCDCGPSTTLTNWGKVKDRYGD
jgi:hypothetical protein